VKQSGSGIHAGRAGGAPSSVESHGYLVFSGAAACSGCQLYDVSGRLVRTLANEESASPGFREIPIDGSDAQGRSLASGVYP
jgi:hypothetical protein